MCMSIYDEINYLVECKEKYYPFLIMNSKNKNDFESRCYEIDICDQVLESMIDCYYTDPEEILFSYLIEMEHEADYFKHNKKRLNFIEKMINVIENLDKQLKIFRGEPV